ncbi:MAG: hypothetical protein GYA43_13890 [Bacteroidales bacterium]|nr:hypothetical protein [Bacteroidales bacterium]
MNEWIIILVLLILFLVLRNILWYAAFKDFSRRQFSDPRLKSKWRWTLYFAPFGYLFYLKRYYNMPDDYC